MFGYVGNDPVNRRDPLGLASLVTSISGNYTVFDPTPEDPEGEPLIMETRVVLDSSVKDKTAAGPITSADVYVRYKQDSWPYGPMGAYIEVDRDRQRNIHGGGTCKKEASLKPRQGWCPTYGCTRGQNDDVQELARRILHFKYRHPGVKIHYERY